MVDNSCCTPPGPLATRNSRVDVGKADKAVSSAKRNCIRVEGGRALLGTNSPLIAEDGEGPLTTKRVRPLWWEKGTVSIAQFRQFVRATDHVTTAEEFGWSFVFHSHIPGGAEGTMGVEGHEWWRRVDGATWERPRGPDAPTAPDGMPVTHVSYTDAAAYAAWAGGRLPHEAEWEHAARGGLGDVRYPWGDQDPDDVSFFPCNIWQGEFPHRDTGADGYSGPAPALSFVANGAGLHHMVGNVWQWTKDPFRVRGVGRAAKRINALAAGRRVLKGGSFLCHRSYCHRYRIAARTGNTPESTSAHTGFRVVYDQAPA